MVINIYGMDTKKEEINYNALFLPITEYGSPAFLMNYGNQNIQTLQRIILIGYVFAHRTVSQTTTHVIASLTPIDRQLN